ncbi:MAG: hypothetical protein KGN77_13985 [Xanthomonadaceae bacterium]|nr:hypothetical protein [Xanthomonadaceae bacterium]MDE1965152.1 hypothetical protein [Xanthomonadaceae bacterium]
MRGLRGRQVLAWTSVLAAGAAAAAVRYGFIEPPALGERCAAGATYLPDWCAWRELVVQGFLHDAYGVAALVATALAMLRPRRWTATLAAGLGLAATVLYCYETGALALLAGSLLLVREDDPARTRPPRRHGEQDIQAQP